MVSAGRISLIVVAFLAFVAPGSSGVTRLDKVTSPGAANATPGKYANCKALNRRYPHGIGRSARHKHLDRDGDKIPCEKR